MMARTHDVPPSFRGSCSMSTCIYGVMGWMPLGDRSWCMYQSVQDYGSCYMVHAVAFPRRSLGCKKRKHRIYEVGLYRQERGCLLSLSSSMLSRRGSSVRGSESGKPLQHITLCKTEGTVLCVSTVRMANALQRRSPKRESFART